MMFYNKLAPIKDLLKHVSNIHSYNTAASNKFYVKPSRLNLLNNSFSRFRVLTT